MNLLPGLHEALRLMALNELDFAPGTIMNRIEQLEAVELVPAETELDHLKSTVAQRDEQLRVALDEVRQWKESVEAVALSSKEVEGELSETISSQQQELTTAQKERDAAIAACAAMRDALEYCGCHEHSESPCDESGSHYKSDCVFCNKVDNALSPTIGTTFLERMRLLEVALGECVVALECMFQGPDIPNIRKHQIVNTAISHAQALLNERSK